ncbi:MAG: protoheme IX farnesyltransferase [Saprospiraceae bacterium]|nr:protoheme IX farnesyltransferase [Candidatus Vicinibacter proximus]MCC6843527.1 protoheme IX farnesyltransferase [Saprospiraceae bacterium]HRG31751.1 protoheme IX farnesyltransferase [Saprospiraceae bacterium]
MRSFQTYTLQLKHVFADLGLLVKFKLSLMVVFSSLAGYIIFAREQFDWLNFILLGLGGMFITFSANAINQVLERDFDKLMIRTMNRPLADGRMTISFAVLLAGLFATFGALFLFVINSLAATLGMLSLVLYAFVYTPLKRYSTLAVPVGAIPGALPALIAGVAAQNGLTNEALCLFGIQYLWQFPHFWSIAWLGHKDYTQAGFKLIKDNNGSPDPAFGLYSAFYALLSILFLLPALYNSTLSISYFLILVITIFIYSFFGFQLFKKNDRNSARQLMFVSIIYLPVVLIVFILNNYMS